MLPSISEITENQSFLFYPKTFSGTRLTVNSLLSDSSSFFSNFEFRQVYVNMQPVMGGFIQKKEPARLAQFVYKKQFKNLSRLMLSFGDKNLVQLDTFPYLNPNKLNTSVRFRCDFSSSQFLPSILTNLQTKYTNLTLRLERNLMKRASIIDIKASIGSPFLSFSIQYSQNIFNRANHFYTFVLSQHTDKQKFQIIYKQQITSSLSLRYQKRVLPQLQVGVMYSVDNTLWSSLALAWIAHINNSIIHSSVSSNLIVSTVYQRKLHETCDYFISANLDHSEQNYTFGLGLQWDL